MKQKRTELDFTDQVFYIGLDVHKNSWTVTIRNSNLKLKTFSMNPETEELIKYMKKNYPNGTYKSVYEAGFSGFSADRELRAGGIQNIVVNPAQVPSSHKEKVRKADTIDSGKLARELEKGSLEGIYIPSLEEEGFRALCRVRTQLIKDQTRIKNRIKSLLHYSGVVYPEQDEISHWSGNFISFVSGLTFSNTCMQATMKQLIDQLQSLRKQIAELMRQLKETVNNDKAKSTLIRRLTGIPGIGFTSAIILYSELMNMGRFPRFDNLCSFVGLIPDVRSSGEKEITLGLSRIHLRYLRNILVEAAWTAVRKDPALTLAFSQLCKRMSKQEAIIRISKKLLSRIMYVWKQNKDYVPAVVA